MITNKQNATQEMMKWVANFNKESNDFYKELQNLKTELEKTKKDIAVATIGFGKAINIMQQSAENLESKIKGKEICQPNMTAEFTEKFGKSYYDFKF